VAISNPDLLPVGNKRQSWNKKLKKALTWMSSMPQRHWWYLSHKEVRSWGFTTWLKIWKSIPQLKSGIFKCFSWLNGSFFAGNDRGFLKEGVKPYRKTPMSPLT
jgi:hypothetical protein